MGRAWAIAASVGANMNTPRTVRKAKKPQRVPKEERWVRRE
jgi:hypothetical protein